MYGLGASRNSPLICQHCEYFCFKKFPHVGGREPGPQEPPGSARDFNSSSSSHRDLLKVDSSSSLTVLALVLSALAFDNVCMFSFFSASSDSVSASFSSVSILKFCPFQFLFL